MQNIQQTRAKHALDKVNAMLKLSPALAREFKVRVRDLPTMIHVNGFGQGVAFYLAKAGGNNNAEDGKNSNANEDSGIKKRAYREVYDILEKWLTTIPGQPYFSTGTSSHSLIEQVANKNMQVYRLGRAESLAYLSWLKQFSEALIVDENDKKTSGADDQTEAPEIPASSGQLS